MRLHRNGGRWPCWILLEILPRAIALIERCSMVDIMLKQAHIPPRSPIRVRDQKCWHGRKRWQRIACHPCEPQVASMSIGSVCMLIGLVSSSAMSYSNRLFTESDALTWSLFSISPLNNGRFVYCITVFTLPLGSGSAAQQPSYPCEAYAEQAQRKLPRHLQATVMGCAALVAC